MSNNSIHAVPFGRRYGKPVTEEQFNRLLAKQIRYQVRKDQRQEVARANAQPGR
jgi:hypothetical protein